MGEPAPIKMREGKKKEKSKLTYFLEECSVRGWLMVNNEPLNLQVFMILKFLQKYRSTGLFQIDRAIPHLPEI